MDIREDWDATEETIDISLTYGLSKVIVCGFMTYLYSQRKQVKLLILNETIIICNVKLEAYGISETKGTIIGCHYW
jgi:hypothetical protein